jgi:cytoskeletal protein RodZ
MNDNKKNYYRILAAILTLMLVCMSFAACKDAKISEKENSAPETEITEASDDPTVATQATTNETTDEVDSEEEDAKVKEDSKDKSAKAKTSDETPAVSAPAKAEAPAKPETSSSAKSSEKSSAPAKKSTKKPAKETKPTESATITVTLSVDCILLYDDDPELASAFSDKGIMVSNKSVKVKKGATVLDVLKASGVSYAGSAYVSKIKGLAEKDGGPESGWCYSVNGAFPSLGVTVSKVKDGDKVAFRYSLNNGLEFGV